MSHTFAFHPDAQARMNMLHHFLQSRQTANDADRESPLNAPNEIEDAEARRTECVGRESSDLSTIARGGRKRLIHQQLD